MNVVENDAASVGVDRFFTIPGRDPFEEVEWELRDAFIPGKDKPVFDQKSVEFPKFGRRPRPTSSRKNISEAGWAPRSARPASSR